MADQFAAAEASDETYFVSLNDMMIGLVFLFIIILMAFALNFRTAEQSAEQAMEELKKERDELEKERDKLKAQRDMLQALTTRLIDKDALRDALLLDIQGQLAERDVFVVVEREKGILRLPEDLLFASGEADMSPRGARCAGRPLASAAKIAALLRRGTACHEDRVHRSNRSNPRNGSR